MGLKLSKGQLSLTLNVALLLLLLSVRNVEELDEVLHQDGVVARPDVLAGPGGAGEAAVVGRGGLGGEIAR